MSESKEDSAVVTEDENQSDCTKPETVEETKEKVEIETQSEARKSETDSINTSEQHENAFKVPQFQPIVPKKTSKVQKVPEIIKEASEVVKSEEPERQDEIQNNEQQSERQNKPIVKKSPAEILKEQNVPLPYKEPTWSSVCEEEYGFEVLKNGVINSTVKLTGKSFVVFGRLAGCDNVLYHPSISRYHAVVQYRKNMPNEEEDDDKECSGCYLYDLGSTHGTFLNKVQIKPKVYYRIRVGHMIKFGKSTRMYILQGPSVDQEDESNETVTELIEIRKKREESLNKLENDDDKLSDEDEGKEQSKATSTEDSGISWGMGEDADEETDLSVNPYALSTANEELYLDDPKKTLRGYFEREGCELEYKVEEKGYSHFICRIDLPLDTATGQPIIAEASVKGKKKEAVVQCALEACRILDKHGVLRQAKHESRKRKEKNWEAEDYYDSDDDTFLDRTGMIEKKRQQRMLKANKSSAKVETYDSLKNKFDDISKSIKEIEDKISTSQKSADADGAEDSLEAYMSSVDAGSVLDHKTLSSMKIQLSQLRQEKSMVEKLMAIAKPADIPALKKLDEELKTKSQMKRQLPLTGSMRGKNKRYKYLTAPKVVPSNLDKPEIPQHENVVSSATISEDKNPDVAEVNKSPPAAKELPKAPDVSEVSEAPVTEKTTEESRIPILADAVDNEEHKKEEPKVNEIEEIEKRNHKKKLKLLKKKEKMNYEYDSANPDYAMWVPPDDQAGDGKTHLNAKFGY